MTIVSRIAAIFTAVLSEPAELARHAHCCSLGSMLRYLLTVIALGACGSVDHEIEDQITIEQGVYGLLISGCDTSGCQDQPAAGELVTVYATGAVGAFSKVTSDDDGVYQIDLAAGDYTLCTYSCVTVSVPAHAKVRYDWTSGPGGGRWWSSSANSN